MLEDIALACEHSKSSLFSRKLIQAVCAKWPFIVRSSQITIELEMSTFSWKRWGQTRQSPGHVNVTKKQKEVPYTVPVNFETVTGGKLGKLTCLGI